MSKSTRICKTCGKEYEYCHTPSTDKFRWQDVACSPECGTKYFAAVLAARGESATVNNTVAAKPQEVKVETEKATEATKEAEVENKETSTAQAGDTKPLVNKADAKLANN